MSFFTSLAEGSRNTSSPTPAKQAPRRTPMSYEAGRKAQSPGTRHDHEVFSHTGRILSTLNDGVEIGADVLGKELPAGLGPAAGLLSSMLSGASRLTDPDAPTADVRGAREVSAGVTGGSGLLASAALSGASAGVAPAAFLAGQFTDLVSGGVDAANVAVDALAGHTAASYRGAEKVEDSALNGDCSQVAQALTLATSPEARDAAISHAAEAGEHGKLIAASNFAADALTNEDHAAPEGGTVECVPDVLGNVYRGKSPMDGCADVVQRFSRDRALPGGR